MQETHRFAAACAPKDANQVYIFLHLLDHVVCLQIHHGIFVVHRPVSPQNATPIRISAIECGPVHTRTGGYGQVSTRTQGPLRPPVFHLRISARSPSQKTLPPTDLDIANWRILTELKIQPYLRLTKFAIRLGSVRVNPARVPQHNHSVKSLLKPKRNP